MGRHALIEALDVPSVTPSQQVFPVAAACYPAEVRTVAEIIAQFRQEQGLAYLPTRRAREDAGVGATPTPCTETAEVVVGPWPTRPEVTAETATHDSTHDSTDNSSGDSTDDATDDSTDDDDRPAGPTGGDDVRGPDTGEIRLRTRRHAAWQAALQPGDRALQPRRRRANGSNASAVIATLTAELAITHPTLLDGAPHSRRAAPAARRTAAAGAAMSLQPVRVTGGLRGAALRVPALAGGWKVPTRTPLVLAGAVAVSVVVTDQAGLLTDTAPAASATTASVKALAAAAPADQTPPDVAAQTADQTSARVSRLERSPLTQSATAQGVAPTGTGTAAAAAPPPDSVMKPGQTVPGDWVRPTAKGIYNSCFCSRWGTFHEGIDFAAPLGSPILAVGDGVVVQAGPASGFGNWVIIKHANGDMTIYGHMKYYFVKIGQQVKAGQEIALVGAEGQATGPHLHLGVKIGSTDGHDGTYVDPVPWLTARGITVGAYNENG